MSIWTFEAGFTLYDIQLNFAVAGFKPHIVKDHLWSGVEIGVFRTCNMTCLAAADFSAAATKDSQRQSSGSVQISACDCCYNTCLNCTKRKRTYDYTELAGQLRTQQWQWQNVNKSYGILKEEQFVEFVAADKLSLMSHHTSITTGQKGKTHL